MATPAPRHTRSVSCTHAATAISHSSRFLALFDHETPLKTFVKKAFSRPFGPTRSRPFVPYLPYRHQNHLTTRIPPCHPRSYRKKSQWQRNHRRVYCWLTNPTGAWSTRNHQTLHPCLGLASRAAAKRYRSLKVSLAFAPQAQDDFTKTLKDSVRNCV